MGPRRGDAAYQITDGECFVQPPTSVLYCAVLYCTVLYCTVLYCTVLYCTVLYCTALYYTVLYCTVLYCTVLYYDVLYCTVGESAARHALRGQEVLPLQRHGGPRGRAHGG